MKYVLDFMPTMSTLGRAASATRRGVSWIKHLGAAFAPWTEKQLEARAALTCELILAVFLATLAFLFLSSTSIPVHELRSNSCPGILYLICRFSWVISFYSRVSRSVSTNALCFVVASIYVYPATA